MSVIVCVPVRYSSRRLPGKHFLDIGGRSALNHLLARAGLIPSVEHIILCVGDDGHADRYIGHPLPIGDRSKYAAPIVGDVPNVLSRYVSAIEMYGAKTMVRITGDDCFPDIGLAEALIHDHIERDADYTCYSRYIPGMDIEAYSAKSLLKIYKDSNEGKDIDSEMLKSVYSDSQHKKNEFNPGIKIPDISLTLDTLKDYAEIRRKYAIITSMVPEFFSMADVAEMHAAGYFLEDLEIPL